MKNLRNSKIFFLSTILLFSTSALKSIGDFEINAQNDTVSPGLKIRLSYPDVNYGPSDRFCVNTEGPRVQKDPQGNFIQFVDSYGQTYFTPTREIVTYSSPVRFTDPRLEAERVLKRRAINAFGTISFTKRMIEDDLARVLPERHPSLLGWKQQQPVKLYTLEQSASNNAYFQRDTTGGSIHCFPFVNQLGQVVGHTAEDFDTVAHEAWHNASFVLRPDRDLSRPQTGALDESLGDFMGLTTLLSISDLRERYLRETNCNPRRSSFLTETAESLGRATGLGTHGIRNAVNTVTLGRSSCEVHDLSLVFTGTLYNILVHALEEGYKPSWLLFCNVNERSRKQHLGKINEDLRALVLAAHCYVPYPNPSFSDFGKSMFQIVEGNEYYSYLTPYISGAFEERGISLTAPHTDSSMCDRNALQQYGVMGTRNTHICETLERFKR